MAKTRSDQIIDDALVKLKALEGPQAQGGPLRFSSDDSLSKAERDLQKRVEEVRASAFSATRYAIETGRYALNEYIKEYGTPLEKSFNLMKERFEILDGTRNNKSLGQRAVRFDNIRALERITSQPKSKKAASAPTREEFDALYEDVRLLFAVLWEIRMQMQSHGTSSK